MELIGSFLLIFLSAGVISGIGSQILLKPSFEVNNISLIPTITAHRYNNTVVLSHIRGKTINKCVILINGSRIGCAIDFKIGDIIELTTTINTTIELFDGAGKLLFFAII